MKRTRLLLTVFCASIACLLIPFISEAQSPRFVWAKSIGNSGQEGQDEGRNITTDAAGNIYVTGYFSGTTDFDPGSGVANLISNGVFDIFILKLDPSGNFLWVKQIGGLGDERSFSIDVDASGNVYTTGWFTGTGFVDFDPGPGVLNFSALDTDIFVQKLDAAGNLVWAKQMVGIISPYGKGSSIKVDNTGNVYLTGQFSGSVDFDPGSSTNTLVTTGGVIDIFVQKLNSSGDLVWVKQMAGTGAAPQSEGTSIDVDATGNVYTTGYFRNTVDFDPNGGTSNLTSIGLQDIFIQKLDASGNLVWIRRMGGTNSDIGRSLTLDALNNVYTAGLFRGTTDFDPSGTTLNFTAANLDAYVQKLDASGNLVWAKQFKGTGSTWGYSIVLDNFNNVYTSGIISLTTDFDPGSGVYNLSSNGSNSDIFVSKLDASGNFVWAQVFGGTQDDFSYSSSFDPLGNIYTVGTYGGTADFDPSPGVYNLPSPGTDIFLQKLSQPVAVDSFTPATGPIETTVTITGTNFSTIPSNNIVYFGGMKATVTASTLTQLTVKAPAGATYQPITVTVGSLTGYSAQPFLVTFPDGGNLSGCSFATKVQFSTGQSPFDMALGDLDGDGKLDAVTANYDDFTISILRNTSTVGSINTASFAPKVDIAVSNYPAGVALGDIDGDGKLDIVVANFYGNNISVLRNISSSGSITSASFSPAVNFATPLAPAYLAIRDLDGDGKSDVVVTCVFSSTITIFRNTSVAGIIDATSLSSRLDISGYSGDMSVAAEDVDGDRKADLIVTDHNGSTVNIFRNASTTGVIDASSFESPISFATNTGPIRISVGDLDGDSKQDLVTANLLSNTFSILKNTTTTGVINTSSFATHVDFAVNSSPFYTGITDLDGDGMPDLATAHQASTKVTVYKNITTPGTINTSSFGFMQEFDANIFNRVLALGDIDGNGKPDIATASTSNAKLSIQRNTIGQLVNPVPSGFSPTSGPVGTVVTISGTNFSSTPLNNTVKFNGVTAVVSASTTTSITVTVPVGTTTGSISIEVGCNTAISIAPFVVNTPCLPASENAALVALYNATVGDSWVDNSNWLVGDESTWAGITVSGCHVTEINLSGNNLTGSLPVEIGNFPNLVKLNLSQNQMQGPIPIEIGNLVSLKYLYLNSNLMDGAIPDEVGNLTDLRELILDQNGFNGSVPATISNLMLLQIISLSENTIVGMDPSIGTMNSLTEVRLNNNILGFLPVFTSTNLTQLALENNFLQFDDLEPLIGTPGLTYVPQAKLPPGGVLSFSVGSTLSIPFTTPGTGNSYQWYKGVTLQPGATSAALSKPGMTLADAGFYYVKITSSVVPGLTLESLDWTVTAIPCGAGSGPAGNLDVSFNPPINSATYAQAIELQSSGKIIMSMPSTTINATSLQGVMRFNADGTFDNSFNVFSAATPYGNTLIVQPDDKIITAYSNTYANVIRLNADGTDDVAFNAIAPQYYSADVNSMALQPDGKIIVSHTNYNSPATIDRIKTDGNLDGSFSAPTDLVSNVTRVQSDGFILIAGSFPGGIMRLTTTGSVDASFTATGGDYDVTDMLVQPDGKIIVTGLFDTFNRISSYRVIRLNNDGSVDPTFNIVGVTDDLELFNAPYKILLQPDGKILLAGYFDTVNDVSRKQIVRLNSDGSVDCTFDSGVGPNDFIGDMALQPDGKILIAGNFTSYAGSTRNGLARILVSASVPVITITTQPSDFTGCDGVTASFNCAASGTTNIIYQWQFATTSAGPFNDLSNGAGYSGVTTANLSIVTSVSFGIGRYRCRINGDLAVEVITNDRGLSVNSVPSPPAIPGNSGCSPSSVTLTASGGVNGQYRWYTTPVGGTAIASAVNNVFATPSLSASTNFYAAINNGSCESSRTTVLVTINPTPIAPTATPGSSCAPSSTVTLGAGGGTSGQYRWYTTLTGGSPIAGQINSSFTTPTLSSSTPYFVSINNGTCESARTSVLAEIKSCTPQIMAATLTTSTGGQTSLNITPLVTTINNPIDVNSIKIIQQPSSGAKATVVAGMLQVDYANISFAGTDHLIIEACDVASHCSQQDITIQVSGEIVIYNAVSPNGDNKNDIFYIQYIDLIPNTKDNKVTIFDRWGSIVFEVSNYDNVNRVFRGLNSSGDDLPTGTYYYKIAFSSNVETKTGFISLRR